MDLSPVARQELTQVLLPREQWRRPVLIGIFGLPCTGKTAIARFLAARFPLIALSTDAIRLRYKLASGPETHAIMFEIAAHLLPRGHGVILDGIHLGRKDRDYVRNIAQLHDARCWIIYTTAAPAVIEQRLEARRERPAQTRSEGKFVIERDQMERIATYLDVPRADEDIVTVETSQDKLRGQLAELERHLAEIVRRP